MYLFLVDETNAGFVPNKFFILGGLVFTEEQVPLVDAAVKARREEYGYRNGDSFKFNTHTRPEQVSIENFRLAKQAVISDLREIGVRMIVTVVLHDVAGQEPDRLMEWGLENVAYPYHKLLGEESAQGFMLMDRDNQRYDFLESFHQHGFDYSGSRKSVQDRILLFGMTNDNASHLASATDIALGAFRYCVNAAGGEGRDEIAASMFRDLSHLMWGVEKENGVRQIGGYGYHPSPKPSTVYHPPYRARYERLATALKEYALDDLDE
ncbi:hypothetical protein [Leucobacter luti]|uniref:DUF3800 domain-containing protein n=1 Tax=Leucobacter luti TaxID=340320 RepID=A0A4Q7TIX0_9MICO|nr:hypothetical protein [Leucobacter luti]MBL3699655.1 hypothetical protein [Leucobacter luti]RZT59428.1 hypothetical protein EV139_3099 [Leucobacter luti]